MSAKRQRLNVKIRIGLNMVFTPYPGLGAEIKFSLKSFEQLIMLGW